MTSGPRDAGEESSEPSTRTSDHPALVRVARLRRGALRPLVHAEEGADAVPGPVAVVQAGEPQLRTSERV